ncbi:hypothetical protein J2847_006423 [Azospirillum agricola]|uniref:hypothetical protein n=1 Tax=Azospirillum agricola TaxID=1720247 RepID=UPI001AE25178|nr:hypothetical protein [Azospirillum agricola]MBP2233088.1 hypothetical protein [Azospirillum agricola]
MTTLTKTPVRFLKTAAPYLAGEIAGFPADQAADLVARGVAEHYEDTAKEPPKKAARTAGADPAA